MDRVASAGHRVYRSGASIVSLFFWTVLTCWGSWMALQVATNRPPSEEAKWSAYLIVAFGILFGPIAFLAHFARLCFWSVTVSAEEGLLLNGGRRVTWEEIRSIELKEAAFRGLIRMNPVLLFMTAGCMAVIYYVVLPSVALFTPWHRRVILVLNDGTKLVFRDLAHAEEFVNEVSPHITGSAGKEQR